MKKRENKRNLRLRSLLILLLICAIVFISSTYAWFTTNKTVTVSTINVNVETVAGIQISVDGINWKSSVTTDDIKGAVATYTTSINTLPDDLEPVSSALALDDAGELKMFYGSVEADDTDGGEYKLTAVPNYSNIGGTNGDQTRFVVFDLFVKTVSPIEDNQLYLTKNSGTAYSGRNVGIQNATRIAFVKEGNIADGASTSDIQSLSTTDASNVYLWEPNYDTHTLAAVAHASSTYGITTSTIAENPIPYDGVSASIAGNGIKLMETNATSNPDNFASVTPTYKTTSARNANLPIFGLDSGITKIRVYMWIEGQDVDCENNASGSNIDFNLKFTVDPQVTE